MKILDLKQGSPEWLDARLGIPTASEFDRLITPLGKVRKGDGVSTFLAEKLAERWRRCPNPTHFKSDQMEQGSIREHEARPWYELETGNVITTVGFITTDDGKIGCSPDGLIGDDGGIEIKCPTPQVHVAYLLDGVLPSEYFAQVQGSMFVTGRKWWKFLSYCVGLPPLLLTVEADPKAQEALAEALEAFTANLDAVYAKLVEMNGGPPTVETFTSMEEKTREVDNFPLEGVSLDDAKMFEDWLNEADLPDDERSKTAMKAAKEGQTR